MSALERNPQVPALTPHKVLGPSINGRGNPKAPDHETGGLSIVSSNSDFNLSEQGVEYRWGTDGHSAQMVPAYLYGAGAERLNGIMENSELGHNVPYRAMSLNSYFSLSDIDIRIDAREVFAVEGFTWLINTIISIIVGLVCGGSGLAIISSGISGILAMRTFQALRIEVNAELDVIAPAIKSAVSLLNKGGRIAIITFHSLEDRIVKQTFASLTGGCTCPKNFPVCVCGNKPQVKILTKKPILPSTEELAVNSRSHSAKLRIAEKL